MRVRYGIVAVTIGLLGLTLVLAACSGGASGGGGNTVAMSEYKFDPSTVTVKANQSVTINLRNTGSLVHDWVVQGMPAPVQAEVQPGRSGSVTFTPTQAGTFKILCTQPGHEGSGMLGQLIVQA
jgi:uncharacterized cupredoxin-like copper-binding protein